MKKTVIIVLTLAACLNLRAQTNTTPPVQTPISRETAIQNLVDALTHNQTNWIVETHALYAPGLNNKYGGGVGAFYPFSDFVVAGLRLDYVDGGFYMPSGNATFQVPFTLFNKVKVTPFGYAGLGIPLSKKNTGNVVPIYGVGAAIRFWTFANGSSLSGVYDQETWGGFNGKQHRFGLLYHYQF